MVILPSTGDSRRGVNVLHGPRVTLRAIRRDDLERLSAFNNDVETELAGGGDPPYPQSLERLLAGWDADTAKGGRDGTSFAIEVDGLFIGQCALFHRDAVAGTAELGITIGDKAYWSRGYGRETIGLLLEYAFRYVNIRRVWLQVWANNERGIRCYLACGFVEEGRLRRHVWSQGQYIDLVEMGVLREEWLAARDEPPVRD
jgi:RimJ/RimL family protein N-acetyltransferase